MAAMKQHVIVFIIAALSAAGPARAGGQEAAADAVCIVNGSEEPLILVAEARGGGERKVATVKPGGRLCAKGATKEGGGVVSVFETRNQFEGCSRLVSPGQTEVLEKFADADRCRWASNS